MIPMPPAVTGIISTPPTARYGDPGLSRSGVGVAQAEPEETTMGEPLGAGLTWQQLLAFGAVGLFVGAVKLLDVLHRPVALRPSRNYRDERVLEHQRQSVWGLEE